MMKVIVGLGNPGEKYENTRHNLGFVIIDHLLKDLGTNSISWNHSNKLKSDIATVELTTKDGKTEKIILAKPQTYMNNSGMAVQLLKDFYKIDSHDLWVVYDELDLPLGNIKIRFGGAAAGHHGVESIMEMIGTDAFWRFRLGIGVTHDKSHPVGKHNFTDAKEYVLDPFHAGEIGKAREMQKRATEGLQVALEKGIEAAMNRYNMK